MIDIWVACTDAIAAAPPELGADELARADRFLCARSAATYRAAHALKRRVLSHYAPEIRPHTWRFTPNAWGKPATAASLPALPFNLSHSGDHIVVAAADVEVGVDVEHIRPLPHFAEVARFVFHPLELAWLARQAAPLTAFFRLWTLKEALLKAAGTGFSHPPKQLAWRSLDAPWAVAEFGGRAWQGATRRRDTAVVSVAVPLGSDLAGARLLTPEPVGRSSGDGSRAGTLRALVCPFLQAMPASTISHENAGAPLTP